MSVFDIRKFRDWVDADLSFRTVEDRVKFLKQNVSSDNLTFMRAMGSGQQGGFTDFNGNGWLDSRDLEVETERVRLVWDSNGDGIADRSTVFADGFKSSVSGVAAGVLVRRGDVYFTCIPELVKLRDLDGDGQADERVVLHQGIWS